jgi:chromosome partitioning protein
MLTVVGNLKGGTGKSTVAFNLAVWLAHSKHGVVTFDLDPQATLTDVCDVRREDGFEPLVPVSSSIGELEELVRSNGSHPIIADVSASNMPELEKAVSLASRVLIPIQPSQADIWSTQRFLKIIGNVVDRQKTQVQGFINRADTHIAVRETDEAEEALRMLQGIEALKTRLYQRTAYRRSFSEGLAVFELDPMGKAAQEMKQLAKLLYK